MDGGASAGLDLSDWKIVGGIIGTVFMGAVAAVWGRSGEASAAISQTRAEATEIWKAELAANRTLFEAIRTSSESTRDATVALRDLFQKSSEDTKRLLTCQEAIVAMMRKQAEDRIDDLKLENESYKQSIRLLQKEHEMEMDREESRRRTPHRG